MKIIGLTGGIGCGKTLVSDYFKELGTPVIDADIISRNLVSQGKPLLKKITQIFGKNILFGDSSLDRQALRQHIFNSPSDRKKLESLMHPAINDEIQDQIKQLQKTEPKTNYVIIVIPLLIETQQSYPIDRILVVDCDEAMQIKRVKQRDKSNNVDTIKIISSQCSPEQRLKEADDIVTNNTLIKNVYEQIDVLHEKYRLLSNSYTF